MRFFKFQGLGNDFLIVHESDLKTVTRDYGSLAAEICDRHFGVGADGLEVILDGAPGPEADFAIRLFNSDGGETPISGNGTRCVAAYLYLRNGWTGSSVRIMTGAGLKTLAPVEKDSRRVVFETDMGVPQLAAGKIPVVLPEPAERVIGRKLDVDGHEITFTAVSMGNPHCTVFVDDFYSIDWRRLGRSLEHHPAFPERTNVEFVRIIDRDNIEVRFWERGCGETLASGTGSCGAALASMLNQFTDRRVTVRTAAGALPVEWLEDGRVIQTGEAAFVFEGDWPAESET